MGQTGTVEIAGKDEPARPRRRIGVGLGALGAAAQVVWLAWWAAHLPANPVAVAVLAAETIGLLGTIAITFGLARAHDPRSVSADGPRESHRFAFAVADLVGRTRSTDVHRDVVRVVRVVRTSPLRRLRRSADAAIGAVLLEGPRRLVTVVAIAIGLVVGTAPMQLPPLWAILTLCAAVAANASSHVVLGGGRIRFGDRIRWSYSSIGEVVGTRDVDGVAPRRWVGTIASIVAVNLAIALRGTSDRWTHGLAPMTDDARLAAMAFAIVLVAGGLFTMCTVQAPDLDAERWSRRLEERAARRSALGATVALGLVGLFAGILPGAVDAADDDTVRVEQLVDDQDDRAGTVGG